MVISDSKIQINSLQVDSHGFDYVEGVKIRQVDPEQQVLSFRD